MAQHLSVGPTTIANRGAASYSRSSRSKGASGMASQYFLIVVTVRREKALDFSGCNSRPGTGSLHPVAIEAAAEATKLSELSM